MHDVFLSYASENRELAEVVQARIEEAGLTVWRDPEIDSGDPFRKRIKKALDNTRTTVVLWSRDSVESDWVLGEVELSKRRGPVIQATIEPDVELPIDFLARNAVDLAGWDGDDENPEFQRLIRSIRAKVEEWHRSRRDEPKLTTSAQIEVANLLAKAKAEAAKRGEAKEGKDADPDGLTTTIRRKLYELLGRRTDPEARPDEPAPIPPPPPAPAPAVPAVPGPIADPLPTVLRYLAWTFSVPFALLLALHAVVRVLG